MVNKIRYGIFFDADVLEALKNRNKETMVPTSSYVNRLVRTDLKL